MRQKHVYIEQYCKHLVKGTSSDMSSLPLVYMFMFCFKEEMISDGHCCCYVTRYASEIRSFSAMHC